jgi:hypothetical protein
MISKKYPQVVSILIIIAAVYYSFYSLSPSNNYVSENKTAFSTETALAHLKEISKKPHYTGSEEHKVVRDYIINELDKLGLQVEVQEQIAINKKWKAAANNRNILARIKGTDSEKALMLLSHYDSNPHSSLGASDAGSGVVVILEGIRAFLEKNNQFKNDIIICITDGEELGLLGANAFVNHHPWARDIGLVLNFEARGSGGPSYLLLETNGGNSNLIEAFQKAKTPYPVGSSLMYSIYKMLPNDTDLTVFREDADIDGFNFAFIGDHFDYHTEEDSFERMDVNSLNHQASYLIASLNYFANTDLENLKGQEDYVYFNFPYLGLVFYPFSWVIPMFVICAVLFLVLVVIGIAKNKLTLIGIAKGFIPFIFSLIFSGLITFYGWKLLLKIHPQYNDILHGFTYNGYYYIAVFVSLTLAICFWFYKGFFKKRTAQDLLIAPLFFWVLLNGGISFYLKGAGFFIFPVIVSLLMLLVLIFSRKQKTTILFFTLLSVPLLLIFGPFVKMFPVGLGLKMLVISTVFTVLIFGLLVPVFKQYKSHKNFANLFLLIGVMGLISTIVYSPYTIDRKQPNSILYMFDANKNEAYWASYNSKADDFTKQFLGENPLIGSYDSITTSSKYNTKIQLYAKTEIRSIEKPLITVVSDTIIKKDRKIRISILSNRNANKIELISKLPIQFKTFKINDAVIRKDVDEEFVLDVKKGTVMSFFRSSKNEIVDIEFTVDSNQKIDFDVLEIKFDLLINPLFKIIPRSETMMPMPFILNDATIIKTNVKF